MREIGIAAAGLLAAAIMSITSVVAIAMVIALSSELNATTKALEQATARAAECHDAFITSEAKRSQIDDLLHYAADRKAGKPMPMEGH